MARCANEVGGGGGGGEVLVCQYLNLNLFKHSQHTIKWIPFVKDTQEPPFSTKLQRKMKIKAQSLEINILYLYL